jgi:RNA polymerase sigma factor (sigma-70 family)
MDGRTAAPTIETLLAEREWVRNLARVLAGNGPDADDLEQEAWVAALRSPPERPGPVRGWLATVLRRRCLDAGRAAARRAAREAAAARPEALPSAAESVARAESLRRVVEAVLSLEEPGRSTVILRYFDGLGPRAIADRTGVPLETVRTRLRRALLELRERLGEDARRRRAWLLLLPAAAVIAVAAAGTLFLAENRPVAGLPETAAAPPPPVAEAPPPAPPPAPAPAPVPAPGPAAVPATGLVLKAALEPSTPRFREPTRLVATFENAGKEPVSIFLPLLSGTVPFPEWRFRDADGREFLPDSGMAAQTMWSEGVQGEIVCLRPGESRRVESNVDLLVPADGKGPKVHLGPATFIVTCRYARGDTLVPWSEAFEKPDTRRAVDGLWVGSIEAEPFSLRVLPSDAPGLILSAPEPLVPGVEARIHTAIENTAATPLVLRGRFLLRAVAKGTGVLEEAVIGRYTTDEIRVEPESTLRAWVDLATLPGNWLDRNSLMLVAVFDFAEEGREDLVSDLLVCRVEPLPSLEKRGLRLAVERRGGATLGVTLRNEGEKRIRLPRGFAWPAQIHVEVRDPEGKEITVEEDGGKSTLTTRVLSWDESGAPRTLAAGDFIDLEPGEFQEAIVDLRGQWAPNLPAGSYSVALSWRNVESGVRAGLDPATVAVGTVAAPAVRIDLPAR